jgi:RimJ/RimL family protein N-acetyltransferase
MIETPRLILRPHALEDFEPWYAMFSDEELFRFIGVPRLSREDGWNRLLRYAGHWSLLKFGLFAVLEKASGRFIGEVGHADFHRGLGDCFDGFPEAAWILARSAHGQGFASEAAAAAHRWLKQHHGASRTVCIISPENSVSLHIARRLGYGVFDTGTYKGRDVVLMEHLAT